MTAFEVANHVIRLWSYQYRILQCHYICLRTGVAWKKSEYHYVTEQHSVLANQTLHGVCCLRREKHEDRKCSCLPIPQACARSSSTLFLFVQSVFDELDGEEMRRARTRSNPYEMIRGVFFLNRFVELLVV